jgi:hypothetical protein
MREAKRKCDMNGKPIAAIALAIAALALVVAEGAAATAPASKAIKGGVYESQQQTPSISFAVASNGKSISSVEVNGARVPCSFPATAFVFATHARIAGNRFTVRAVGTPGGGRETQGAPIPLNDSASASVTGTFLANGTVRARYTASGGCLSHLTGKPSGIVEHASAAFTSTAHPDGANSLWCADHRAGRDPSSEAQKIEAQSVSCAAVDEALAAGVFTKTEGGGFTFAIAGWTCSVAGFTHTCTQPPSRRFRFYQAEQPK